MPATVHQPSHTLQLERQRPARRSTMTLLLAGCGLLALTAAAPARASDALAQKYGCLGCHAKASALVGPSYQAVAERYAGQADAAAALAKKIRAGGAGVWGDVPMPPQAAVTEADAKRLAAWVLKGPK